MRKRIDRLEKSILSVISSEPNGLSVQQSASPPGPVTDDDQTDDEDEDPRPVGQKISVDTRSTHWDAILNEVCLISRGSDDRPP